MLNFKQDRVRLQLWLRWATLGCLLLAVAAAACFGGLKPQAQSKGAGDLLTAQLQAHIGQDAQPKVQAVAGESITPEPKPEPNPEPEPPAAAAAEPEPSPKPKPEIDPDADTEANANVDLNLKPEKLNEVMDEVVDYAPEPWAQDPMLAAEASLQQLQQPLSGSGGLSRAFGYGYDAAFGDYRFHSGVDLAGSLGAAVLAPLPGEIKEIRQDAFTGSSLILQHEGNLQSHYYGLEIQPGLKQGQQVIAGEKLGQLCTPAPFEEAAGPHLHWELTLEDEHIDPTAYLK